MNIRFLRAAIAALLTGLLLSCGGGGSGGVPSDSAGAGSSLAGSGSPAGGGSGSGGTTGDGSTSTAGAGGDSGVGSGGTGVSTADATSVGSVDGLASIIVGGLRYDVDRATVDLEDAQKIEIGMSVAVTGPVDAAFANGIARRVMSMAQLRGPVSDLSSSSFKLLGTTVNVDEGTVWGDGLTGLANLAAGSTVQVWGLPASPGVLRATRIEAVQRASALLLTGTLTQLDTNARTFVLGGLTVSYGAAAFSSGLEAGMLANGRIVRVQAAQQPTAGGHLEATRITPWYALPVQAGTIVQVESVITEFQGLGAFRLSGTLVDASAANVTGGQKEKLMDGVTVVASGTLSNGVLVARQVKIRHLPGVGVLPYFNVRGVVGGLLSPADFRVQGQRVDASAPGVVFVNGTASQLTNGVNVSVKGAQVVNGVLHAAEITFL